MRKYAIKGIEIFHGFLLLSIMYCAIMQQVTKQEMFSFYKSLLFLPVVGALSVCVKKVKHFWQYLLICVILEAAVFFVPSGYGRMWLGVGITVAAASYFISRAGRNKCWLDSPEYPWLIMYLIVYIMGERFESDFLIHYASMGAGIYYLVCNFHTNLIEVDEFMKTHAGLERLPVRRMGRTNQWMMSIISGITAAAMFAAPYLGIDGLLRKLGNALRMAVTWLLSLIPSPNVQDTVEQVEEKSNDMGLGAFNSPSLFWQIVYKIMDIIGWIFAIILVLLVILMIIRKIYALYRRFNEKIEENGDRIETLLLPPAGEKKKNLGHSRKENLFWNRSNEARIRKYYKKKVQKDMSESPPAFWTPQQIEDELNLDAEDKIVLREYYEKARYSNENCTKEELRKILNIK
jgi:hypothetical protein